MQKDWNTVARQSNIKDISAERNAYHRNLFRKAGMIERAKAGMNSVKTKRILRIR